MIFRQFLQQDLSCASYMVGAQGSVAVVDPQLEIGEYLEAARYLGASIEHILETHTHADHVSGHGRLAAATGATIHIHGDAQATFEHEPFEDGWELELGELRIRAIHTPGHRPEHTAFALIDTSRSPQPWALLTGDTLFVGDIARPDLAVDEREGARGIYRSLHDRLLQLAPETEVWPGHLGGSMCGSAAMDPKISSTLGYERRTNDLLGETDEQRFVERSIARIGAQPPNFHNIVEINRGPLETIDAEPRPLTPRQLQRWVAEGALLVDVRTSLQFDDAHIPGATHATMLEPGFASKLAWLAEPDQRLVFVGRDDADGVRSATLVRSVGLRGRAGYLAGGMTAWREERRPARSVERIDVPTLRARYESGEVQVLDVRERDEWEAGHIPGSVHVPWHDIEGVPGELDDERPVAAICGSGHRAGVAASLLQRHGHDDVLHVVDGGVPTWAQRGWPIDEPSG